MGVMRSASSDLIANTKYPDGPDDNDKDFNNSSRYLSIFPKLELQPIIPLLQAKMKTSITTLVIRVPVSEHSLQRNKTIGN